MINLIPTVYANSVDLSTNYGLAYPKTVGEAFSHLVRPGFEIAGTAVVLYLLIGGFRYITSGGEKEALAGARAMITHGIIGFILLILLFAVLKFIPEYLGLGIKLIP